jgi:hypothetical protein
MAPADLVPDYGSTMSPIEPKEGDASFDTDNMYYVKPESLTPAQRWRKILLLGVPIACALLIVGGAATLLLRDFGSLYPGPGGSSGKRTGTTVGVRTHPEDSSNVPAPAPHEKNLPVVDAPTIHKKKHAPPSTSSDATAACSAHEACSALIGICCPSEGGIFLECCN